MDILSKIGGITASLSPMMGMVAPAMILFYLHSLSLIIISKHKDKYKAQVLDIYKDYKQFLLGSCLLNKPNEIFDSEYKIIEIKKFLMLS